MAIELLKKGFTTFQIEHTMLLNTFDLHSGFESAHHGWTLSLRELKPNVLSSRPRTSVKGSCWFQSNFKKEKWEAISIKEETYRTPTVIAPPERPPPRSLSDLNTNA